MAMPALLGVDVGFSQTRKSTGLAWLINGQVDTALTGTSWLERSSDLPRGIKFVLAALDAPIVHDDQAATRRRCEFVFYGGAFSKRCRPGLSHYGRGLLLREAGRQSMRDFAQALMPGEPISGPLVVANLPVIEAFPNTFMGVLIPENHYSDWTKTHGIAKSDWLYEELVELGLLRQLLQRANFADKRLERTFEQTTHHDKRAALICLLTAIFAYTSDSKFVGDPIGGWFWLPPMELWAPWATTALNAALNQSPSLETSFKPTRS